MDFNDPKNLALAKALAKAQSEFGVIAKNRTAKIKTTKGYSYEIKYADLDEINRATRPALTKHDLSLIQPLQTEVDNNTTVTVIETILMHGDGGHIKSRLEIRGAKQFQDQKEFAAEVSYMRRYAVTAMLGLAADDDADQNGRGLGDGDDDPLAGVAAELREALQKHHAEMLGAKTDKDALDYWNTHKAKFASSMPAYNYFKDECVKHRTSLKKMLEGATA